MPIYEYVCKECGQESEMLIRSSEETASCPHCGSDSMKKVFSTFAVSVGSGSSESACADGNCPLPSSSPSPCASGTCPL